MILGKFAEQHPTWLAAVEAVAELDALMSLAVAAASGDGDMCRCAFPYPCQLRPLLQAPTSALGAH